MAGQISEKTKVNMLNCRWLATADPEMVLGIVLMRDTEGQPYVMASNCLAKNSAVDNADYILTNGARIYSTDANIIQAFLQDKSNDEIFAIAEGGHHKKIVFYRWIQWVLELMNQPQEYGQYLVQDPNWAHCFEDEMSPSEAFGEAKDAGVIVKSGDCWVVHNEAAQKALMEKAIGQVMDGLLGKAAKQEANSDDQSAN